VSTARTRARRRRHDSRAPMATRTYGKRRTFFACLHTNTQLPKTTKWLSNVVGDVHAQADKLRSLSLINVEQYAKTYARLKRTYARRVIDVCYSIVRCTEHTFVVVACKCTASVEERRQVHEVCLRRHCHHCVSHSERWVHGRPMPRRNFLHVSTANLNRLLSTLAAATAC
jgi:hypothetical protein